MPESHEDRSCPGMGGLLRLADGGKRSQIGGDRVGGHSCPPTLSTKRGANLFCSSAAAAERRPSCRPLSSFSSSAPSPQPSRTIGESVPVAHSSATHPACRASPTYSGLHTERDGCPHARSIPRKSPGRTSNRGADDPTRA